MHSRQSEAGHGSVIELGASPSCRRVASAAIRRELGLSMVRIRSAIEIFGVTSETSDGSALGEAIGVA